MSPSLLLTLAVAVGAPGPKDDPKRAASLEGEWAAEKLVDGGRERDRPIRFTFGPDGKFAVREGNREKAEEGSYKADPGKDPAEVDIMPPEGRTAPPILGIYKLDGDTLTLCVVKGGKADRPARFESPDGSRVMLITLKRQKKD
jgi:uncharacterized protein (TIGR03067 family)